MSIEFENMGIEGHPAENQLLLALERELPPNQAAEIEQHLGNCWSCRARINELQRGVLAFVEYREKRYLPAVGDPPQQFRDFPSLLQAVARKSKAPGLLEKIRRFLPVLLRRPRGWAWVSATAATMAFVIFWTQVIFNPVTVSADELLSRASAAQNPEVAARKDTNRPVAHRAVHQRVRISNGTQTVTRDFDWVAGSLEPRWGSERDLDLWNVPLTADAFAEWRKSLPTKKDEVKRSADRWTLDTIAGERPTNIDPVPGADINEAWIVVRTQDFHPIRQHIRFADGRQLDFEELLFEMKDQAPSVDSIDSARLMARNSLPRSNPSVPISPVNLDETELQLRYVIFTHQWDLGEDLTISRTPDAVKVSGTASSAEVKESMQTVLGMLPNVEVKVDAPVGFTPADVSNPATSARQVSRAPTPLLEDILNQAFDSPASKREFIDQCIDASAAEVSHGWALKRLVDRYSMLEQRVLTPESQARLIEMLRSHLHKVSDANVQLASLVRLLPDSHAQKYAVPTDWRAIILALFAQVRKQDSLVGGLVAGAQLNGASLQTNAEGLRSSYEAITALLSELQNQALDR